MCLHLAPDSVTTDLVPMYFLSQISYHQMRIVSIQCMPKLSPPSLLQAAGEERRLQTHPIHFRGQAWPVTFWRERFALEEPW